MAHLFDTRAILRRGTLAAALGLILAAPSGCNSQPEATCVAPVARVSEQGRYLNGRYLNGRYLNGRHLNGTYLNGRMLNGAELEGVWLEGTSLIGVAGGDTIAGADWIGTDLTAVVDGGDAVTLTISEVATDPADPELVYVSLTDPDGVNICGDAGTGFFVEGTWDRTASWLPALDIGGRRLTMTYSCTSGVIAKCILWGYAPWRTGRALHQSCTRMARADYCGDGVPHTEDGTSIDLFDRDGLQVPTVGEADGYLFEAGWGPDGAVCAVRTRYLDLDANGDVQRPWCWNALPTCASWGEALAAGAITGNSSTEQIRRTCTP